MKLRTRNQAGYALIVVVTITMIVALTLGSTMSRTFTNAKLNDRSNDYLVALNAAEAATEKVVARLRYDFQSSGMTVVKANLELYKSYYPNEDPYWTNFVFSDGAGHLNKTYVGFVSNYVGALPSQYPGLYISKQSESPIYRVISNVKGPKGATAAVQEDVLLALVPINQYAIFYNGLLEFSTAAPMTVNGRVHANGPIYTGSSSKLTINGTVTTTDTITSPKNNNQGPSWSYKGEFKGTPPTRTNVPSVVLSIGSTNVHGMIEVPPSSETPNEARMYHKAHLILTIDNTNVNLRVQSAPATNDFPAACPNPTNLFTTVTNSITNVFPFLSTNKSFYDQRESKYVLVSEIDVGRFAKWVKTNSTVLSQFEQTPASGNYPTILFVADRRTASGKIAGVRLTNGIAPPVNGGLGFTVATPNPLYVVGHYNCTNSSDLGTSDTSSTVPCALMSDALTILSSKWNDALSTSTTTSSRAAVDTTVNAAVLTGVVPSTGNTDTTFSGGVHNLPRLLEDWNTGGSKKLTLNTSIMSLYNSTIAKTQFRNPSDYYVYPTRNFNYDTNFYDPAKQPPGIPTALVLVRMNWGTPPPDRTDYNVKP